ncbi:DUF4124 domain-containing protein [Microbulbifer thermotolerans]|uniref:DUF4124 domain-containing protein n=1 Tax=Microbulbifer thermotolerans TaxID=252514 RepID=A0A143HIW0_MICTH|nr:DUF4124 domain-containing protein [Microbulbifer thermotolerans]AMX01654.1 hypothetical protein A3224_02815 [Microbulbifer thermotolerans]MCX2780262.1 DUF4124 domain-containing protein [Microbulbifer thermotolerans]MCX2783886.1 DUF4124 domain-containing protein [Microbulbifer thermotolerans]MCX2795913.1 DUF4124 domain-containing protein [Microbulbifer thermotolerans]MCX2802594.1 DUF4124 domain-containing protein [Microbulbifer thermotolerans]
MRFAIAILISALAFAARADGIYKWVDENGVVHFGSQPPQKQSVEVVKKPKSERYKQWQAEQAALNPTPAEEPTSSEKNVAAAPKAQPEQQQNEALTKAQEAVRAQRCRMAQSNLQELTTHSRIRELGADGKMRVLPEEERQERIRRMQQTIQENC